MKREIKLLLLGASVLLIQACAMVPETDPDKDAAHKRANREEYAERIQD